MSYIPPVSPPVNKGCYDSPSVRVFGTEEELGYTGVDLIWLLDSGFCTTNLVHLQNLELVAVIKDRLRANVRLIKMPECDEESSDFFDSLQSQMMEIDDQGRLAIVLYPGHGNIIKGRFVFEAG